MGHSKCKRRHCQASWLDAFSTVSSARLGPLHPLLHLPSHHHPGVWFAPRSTGILLPCDLKASHSDVCCRFSAKFHISWMACGQSFPTRHARARQRPVSSLIWSQYEEILTIQNRRLSFGKLTSRYQWDSQVCVGEAIDRTGFSATNETIPLTLV